MSNTYHHEAGKGDAPRPRQVSADEYGRRWDQAFGQDKKRIEGRCPYCGCGMSTSIGWARECLRCYRRWNV